MPSPKSEAAKNLAKYIKDSKEKQRMYHGTDKNFSSFNPNTFLTSDPKFAGQFPGGSKPENQIILPVYANVKNPWDYNNKAHVFRLTDELRHKGLDPDIELGIHHGDWYSVENPEVIDAIKKLGHDSVYVNELGNKNLMVFEPTQIKSAIGNRGTFDPLDPDITKKEGGKINPFKSPREMLFEMAGIPSMAGGGKPAAAMEMYKLITQAIERYTQKFGRPPSPEDVQALKQHAKEISQKAEIKTDPATQARARHEMATDPNLINPEGPDPFLTKATTGRTVKGTYLKPKVQDINDPNVRQNIEIKQQAGQLEDILPESITPSADYMARTSKAIENQVLASGSTPMIDKLKAAFYAKNKRYPTDEELEIIIAEFNPVRHQYGEKGAMIVGERPPTSTGMADWRQRARTEGIPEAYLDKPPSDYPKYLQDALNLSRGVQPGTKPLSNARINPDRSYAEGGPTARQMEAELAIQNRNIPRFNEGGKSKRGYQQSIDAVKDFLFGVRDAPRQVISKYAEMATPEKLYDYSLPGVDVMAVPQGRLIPFEGQGSGAYETGKTAASFLGDPVNLLFTSPVMQGAKKAVTTPFKFATRNPVKASVMAGAVPAVSIGSDETYNK